MDKIKIGLFGFGCVGQGLYDIVNQIEDPRIEIVKICVKNIDKPRKADKLLFTDRKEDIFRNSEINTIVEVIDHADDAYQIAKEALSKGYQVVTANKKMVASYFGKLNDILKQTKGTLLYDAAVCGAIPVISNLENYFKFDDIHAIEGVFNGTTNFILSHQFERGISYGQALKDAQEKGFAETDPSADVDGFDAKYKLKLVIAHAYNLDVSVDDILTLGISTISDADIKYATFKDQKIKLLAKTFKSGNKVAAYVAPIFVNEEHPSFHIHGEDNYASIDSQFSAEQVLRGKGAGSFPTGSAVMADVLRLLRNEKYHLDETSKNYFTNQLDVEVRISGPSWETIEEVHFLEEYQTYKSEGYFARTGKVSFGELLKVQDKDIFVGFLKEPVHQKVITEPAEIF